MPSIFVIKMPSNERALYLLTFTLSMAISLFVTTQDIIVNADGVLYFDVARHFLDEGFTAAYRVYDWPFYGILIGLVHLISTLSYEHSAYLLNSLLVSTACTTFVAIYRSIAPEGSRPWFAAILILSLPVLNDYRELVIRDFGFWAFCLIGLLSFIRFTRSGSIASSLAWQLSLITATLFRIEGIVFSVAPALFFLGGTTSYLEKLRKIFASSFLFIGVAILGVLAVAGYGLAFAGKRAYTLELWLSYISPLTIFDRYLGESTKLHDQLSLLSSTSEASIVLGAGLLSLAAFKLFSNAFAPYLLVAAYGSKKRWLNTNAHNKTLILFFLLSLLPILGVLLGSYFLSSRHTILAVLLLSLMTFQYVDAAFSKLASLSNRRWLVIASVFVGPICLDGIISTGSSKTILRTSSIWALENVDRNATWICNEPRLRFYTGNKCELVTTSVFLEKLRKAESSSGPQYFLLWVSRKNSGVPASIERMPHLQLIDARENKKGGEVLILGIRHSSTPE